MRLRQAHAILEAATALEAAGLDIELWPFDHDDPTAAGRPTDDYMTGCAQFTDPDMNGLGARTYNIDIRPGPDDGTIVALLTYGFGDDAPSLLYSKHNVSAEHPGEPERFRGLVGAQLAEKIAEIVSQHEQPFRATYEERSGKRWEST